MRIGDILVGLGLVKKADVEAAVAYQRAHGVKLGASFAALGLLSVETIVSVLENQRDLEIHQRKDGGLTFSDRSKP